jgi:iron complex transport system ATP-binding protein
VDVTPLLEARELSWSVGGRPLVRGVDLEVRAGELVALVGPNGAGKSTLLRLVAGELEPERGSVRLAGAPLGSRSLVERARLRAVMPQETLLRFAFTVRQVVELGRFAAPDPSADERVVDEALRTTGVAHLASRAFPTLSGGERALATLARVLAQEAPLLLLDEPTASLDLSHQQHAMAVARAAAEAGGGVLAVVHDLNLAATYADRIVLLADGRVVAAGPPWEVLTEERLEAVFGCPVVVVTSPCGDCPLVVPVGAPRAPRAARARDARVAPASA